MDTQHIYIFLSGCSITILIIAIITLIVVKYLQWQDKKSLEKLHTVQSCNLKTAIDKIKSGNKEKNNNIFIKKIKNIIKYSIIWWKWLLRKDDE